jgi:hypothetical protein
MSDEIVVPRHAPSPSMEVGKERNLWKELAQRVIDGHSVILENPEQAAHQLWMCLRQVERIEAYLRDSEED